MHLFQTIALFKKFTCYQGCILNICIKYFPSSTSILCKVVTHSSTLQKKKKICLLFSVLSWLIKKQSFQNLRLFFPTNIISDLSIVFSVPQEITEDQDHSRLDSMVLLIMKLDQLDQDIENALSSGSSPSSTPTYKRRHIPVSQFAQYFLVILSRIFLLHLSLSVLTFFSSLVQN